MHMAFRLQPWFLAFHPNVSMCSRPMYAPFCSWTAATKHWSIIRYLCCPVCFSSTPFMPAWEACGSGLCCREHTVLLAHSCRCARSQPARVLYCLRQTRSAWSVSDGLTKVVAAVSRTVWLLMKYLYALQRLPPRNTLRALHLQQSGEKGLHPEPKPAHAADACVLLQLHSCDPFGQ